MQFGKIKKFLLNVLLVIELTIYVAYVHCEKVLFVGIIALDQYTKSSVMHSMTVGESVPVIKNFFHFTYVLNPGAAFGILPNQRAFFIAAGVFMLVLAIIYYATLKSISGAMKYGAITAAAGSVANLIDRIQLGFVIDFFDFRVFPIFNVADVAIVVGMFIMVYIVLFKPEKIGKFKEVQQP